MRKGPARRGGCGVGLILHRLAALRAKLLEEAQEVQAASEERGSFDQRIFLEYVEQVS